jgi:hypothetical protein
MPPLRIVPLVAALGAALPHAAQAARLNYQIGLSAMHSDNIALVDADAPRSDTVLAPELNFDLTQTGSRLNASAYGKLQYLHYTQGTFDDGFRGSFIGTGTWTLLPDRLEWAFEDYLSRRPIDDFSAFEPGNEQRANLFTTGPTLRVRLGQATRGQLDLRYGRSSAEATDSFDSDRYSAVANATYDLSANRSVGFTVDAARIEFHLREALADYTRYESYVVYSSRFNALDFDVNAGYSRVDFRDRPNRSSQPLLRGDLGWTISPNNKLNLRVSRESTDAADDLIYDESLIGAPPLDENGNPTAPISPDVYEQRRVELGYQFTGDRVGVQLLPYYQRIDYIDATDDAPGQNEYGGYSSVEYRLVPRISLVLQGERRVRQYEDIDREDRDTVYGAALQDELGRHWVARLQVQTQRRNSNVAGQDYKENVALISIFYRR